MMNRAMTHTGLKDNSMDHRFENHAENSLYPIIEPLPLAMFAVNGLLRIVIANKAAGAYAGTSAANLVGRYICHAVRCARHSVRESGATSGYCETCGLAMLVRATFTEKTTYPPTDIVLPDDDKPGRTANVVSSYIEAVNAVLLTFIEGCDSWETGSAPHSGETNGSARQILHDLNQPLQVAMGNIELLMIEIPSDDPRHALAREAQRNIVLVGEFSRKLMHQ